MASQQQATISITRACYIDGQVAEIGKSFLLPLNLAKQIVATGKAEIVPEKTVQQKQAEIEIEQALKQGNAPAPADIITVQQASIPSPDVSTQREEVLNYNERTLVQLQDECKRRDIQYGSRASKNELIALLRGDDEEQEQNQQEA